MTYDPVAYWTERGKVYESQALTQGPAWGVENEPLMALLSGLSFRSVLDVGCGFGRIGELIADVRPEVRYTGLDVSHDLLAGARRRLPDAEFICADLATFETTRRWDLVIGCVVLGHVLPADIESVVAKLRGWARHDLVTVDWDEVGASTAYQFGHDYRVLFGDTAAHIVLGRTAIWHLRLSA